MHINITSLAGRPEDAMSALDRQTGLVAAYVLRPMDQEQPVLVSAWDSAESAHLTALTQGGEDFVSGSFHQAGSTGEAAYAQIVCFDGSRPQLEADAIDRANRERIAPAVRDIPGNLGAFVGRNPDGAFVVVVLTTSLQAIEDSQRALMSTELLPGEDPALLPGPQRIQLAWVLARSSRLEQIPA